MSEIFDFEDRWPELFNRLDVRERNSVRQALAAAWHEGFEPTREHVENLTDYALGLIDDSEYDRRSRAMVKRLLQNTNSKPTSL